jgi:hypothetical protein
VPEPIATWNGARGVWETPILNLLCGQLVPYLGTWPTSGSMRTGCLYPLPASGHLTAVSGSSSPPGLLPTPSANQYECEPEVWEARRERIKAQGINGNGFGLTTAMAVQALLKTPTAQLAVNGGSQHPDKRRLGGHGPTLADQVEHEIPTSSPLLPTPAARDWKSGQSNIMDRNSRPLNEVVEMLLPTPRATDGTHGGPNQRGSSGDLMLPSAVMGLLPTPQAADARRGCDVQMGGERLSGAKRSNGLATATTLLPTPTAMDSHGARNATANRSAVKPATNNDGWTLCDVFWTGESTDQPSRGGSKSSAAQHPGQLSLDELANGSPPDSSSS